MLMSRSPYASLGSMAVAWDMVELPSQLNERWLLDRDLLKRHMRHVESGEAMPDAMIDAIDAAQRHERVTSAWIDYLAPAIVDLELHLLADGREIDPVAVEADIYTRLEMPCAVDAIMRVPNQFHSFGTDAYASSLYAYLWADVMVADILRAFEDAPGGCFDKELAARWRETILGAGAMDTGAGAFRAFRGRDPDPEGFLKRFNLVDA